MAAAGSVGIKGIDLPDIGSDGIKARGTGNHLGAHGTIGTIYGGRDAAKESGVVIGGRTEDITRFIEADSPGVVIKLVKELDIRSIGFETKHAHAEVVFFPVNLAVET